MKSFAYLVVVACLVVMIGCVEDNPMGADTEASFLQHDGVRPDAERPRLPFSGHVAGTFAPVIENGAPVACHVDKNGVSFDGFLMHLEGQGVMSHLGRMTLSVTHCTNADVTTGQYGNGSAVYTGANGDALHAVYDQLGGPTDPAIELIVGGTGRFEHAQGEVEVRVIPSIAFDEYGAPIFPGTFTATYQGWISYDASDRSVRF